MTRDDFRLMVKRAKSSAKDKAMMAAALAGHPTGTGIAAGASLGTILAALGVAARSGDDAKDHSVLSNPLLLGALGAGGGYLAGNALSNTPTRRSFSEREVSDYSMLLGLGGLLGLGRQMAKQDALREFRHIRGAITRGAPSSKMLDELEDVYLRNGAAGRRALLDLKGRHPEWTQYEAPKTMLGRVWEHIKYSPSRPKNALGALNPFKKLLVAGQQPGPKGWARQLDRLLGVTSGARHTAVKGRLPARIAALALLAGVGKGVYDYVHD